MPYVRGMPRPESHGNDNDDEALLADGDGPRPRTRRRGRPSGRAPFGCRLAWPGRTWEPGHRGGRGRPFVIEEVIEDGSSGCGRLVHGDALEVADALCMEGWEGKVDLVYLDPPFASQASYVHEARLDGAADGRLIRTQAYGDRWKTKDAGDGLGEYLEMLAPRLEAAARLLSPAGSLWVHLDWRASYLVRVILDEIFGRDRFLNEVVWRRAPNLGRQAASGQFGRTLDSIVVYGGPAAKLTPPTRLERIEERAIRWDEEGRPFTSAPRGDYTDASIAALEAQGRVHRTKTGKVYIKYFLVRDGDGQWCRERRVDTLWTDVAPLRHVAPEERTGFPTQKPRALLERIIRCGTPPGGMVVDLFCGSATTAEAAHVTGRRFVAADGGHVAVGIARARLLRAGALGTVERVGTPHAPEGPPAEVRVGRLAGMGLEVELVGPSEPLAWAVDVDHAGAPFRSVWHSEHRPGARVVPAASTARIQRHGDALGIKVFGHDGAVSTRTLRADEAK